jgi:hypothetical protein
MTEEYTEQPKATIKTPFDLDTEAIARDMAEVFNKHSLEEYYANTPDWILARAALSSLEAFRMATYHRDDYMVELALDHIQKIAAEREDPSES